MRCVRSLWLCVFTALAAPHAVLAQPSKDPRTVLAKAVEAVSRLPSITYQAQLSGEGALATHVPRLTAKVAAVRGAGAPRVRIDATRQSSNSVSPPSGQPVTSEESILFVNNGRDMLLVEHARKTITTGAATELATGPLGAIYPQQKFITDKPFQEELQAADLTYVGTENITGVACDVIGVKYDSQGTRTSRLFFSTQDGLLRRVEDGVILRTNSQNQASYGRIVLVIDDLQLAPKLDDRLFSPDLPSDYKREVLKSPPPGPPRQGAASPDWSLKTADGTTVSLKDFRGKVVVLDFWATWCGPCRMAMPGMQKLHDKYKGRPVVVYGVNCWERGGSPMEFIKRSGHTYPQLLNADSVAAAYGVSSIPTLIVIDPEGKIIHRSTGFDPAMETRLSGIIDGAMVK
jgi:cytochrome c biogenesis protein CcmG/thiol:disulfide interchange protein DsbE